MEKEEKRADQENDTEEQSTEAKSLLKKKLQYYSSEIQRDVGNLVKWLMIAVLVGCITGAASTLFSFVLKSVTNCRKENEWMFYLLPVMGLIIVYLYEKFGKDDGGTNQVLSTVRSQDDVPILSAPLIFISTALTHLAGGSAGREGAAIQLGGSATATTFATHHFHQFLDFFVGSRTAFQYFTFENQVGTSQRVIEVNYYNIRFDFYYAGIYALTVTSHQRYDVTFFNTFAVKLAIYFKNIFGEVNNVLFVILSVSLICRNGKIKFITFRKSSYLIFEIFECCS